MKSNQYAINTIGTRLRHLRAVFNRAIESKQTTAYPFTSYKLSKVNQQTAKRAISKQDIQKIINYRGKSDMECLAIDLFTFSYFTAGINFIDMAMLERSNIVDGQLVYYRKKTKKRLLSPCRIKPLELFVSTIMSIRLIYSRYFHRSIRRKYRLQTGCIKCWLK